MSERAVIWSPDPAAAAASQLAAFEAHCAHATGESFASWMEFHRFSVRRFEDFWSLFLSWSGLHTSGSPVPVCSSRDVESARFFPNLRLSFTEAILDGGGAADDAIALVVCHEGLPPRRMSRGELRARVHRMARALARHGVGPGSRVAGLVSHDDETIIVALAAVGLGAVWSACGPELAVDAAAARLGVVAPDVLVVTTAGGRAGEALHARALEVARRTASVRLTILTGGAPEITNDLDWPGDALTMAALEQGEPSDPFAWPQFAFDHPVYALFSSGTTGPPKAILHGAGGTLLEHLKEHRLHGDLRPNDRLYFQTSCGWMMWHWTVSALATGASIVTYDGSVAADGPETLWRLVAGTGITALGISPAFIQYQRDSAAQPRRHDLSSLRVVLSTGSMLFERDFDWIHESVGHFPIHSISGGTDIIGCFVLGNPMLPVRRGDSQCVSLAMDVRGLPDANGGPNELVCANPFPSRPVAFLHDSNGQQRHEAYFAQRPGLWTHGDFIAMREDGSARILGRSDSVMKVRGIRIGPAEIVGIVEAMPEIAAAMAVSQEAPDEPGGTRIVLLVVLRDGHALDRALTHRIKRAVRDGASSDHVPALVVDVPALPVTVNGKRSERAARDAVNGRTPANLAALRDPTLPARISAAVGQR